MKEKLKKTLKAKFTGEYVGTTNKEKSIAILLIGFTMLFAILLYCRVNYHKISQNDNNNNNNNNNSQIDNKKTEFLSLDKIFINYMDNYKYTITIEDNNKKIIYEGSMSNGVDNGKKIINNEEIEYHIVNDIAIDLNTNKEINNLYDKYLSTFFVPTNIYEFIKDKENSEDIVDKEKIYIYNSVYKDADIMFKIITGKDRLEEIIYKYNNIDYSIKYN